jgi:hypothetical protein
VVLHQTRNIRIIFDGKDRSLHERILAAASHPYPTERPRFGAFLC